MNALPKNGIIYFGTLACGHGYSEQKLIESLQKDNYPIIIPNEKELISWTKMLAIQQTPSLVIIKNNQVKEKFVGFLVQSQLMKIIKYYFNEKKEL